MSSGGIWNRQLFGGPTSPLTLQNAQVNANTLSGSPGVSLEGGGLYTLGFPATLLNAQIAGNVPDQCFGC